MDTPTIAKYYREKDPMERLKLLEQSIAAGEEPEENRIRKELWEIRYSDKAETGDTRADGYLGLWMTMEFNRNSASRFFGTRSGNFRSSRKGAAFMRSFFTGNAVIWFWSTWISVRQINPITQRFSA